MNSVLIANRGEIAVRIVRACRELGLRSVAVYSDADRLAPHVFLADEAHRLGPPPVSESYLRMDRILEVARRARVDGVHPGYGLLSERAEFARAVEEAGLIFIGPAPETISAMGDKSEARDLMRKAGVPVVPGSEGPIEDADDAARRADEIGYPVVLKAVAGGGGKGMRVVASSGELARALDAARREALAAFGDGAVYLERYLDRPRHIEIQLLGDGRGNVVHLGERECSVQRRHQKLIEESPSPAVSPALRRAMGEAAVQAARSVHYRGAGTIEFLLQDGDFYFIEMNTRIQVEHPVTELVTGVDLVQAQLRVAAGAGLDLEQDAIQFRGHAVECRITAEDPGAGFLPATGTVRHLEIPGGPGVRWDGGITLGSEVGLHYDPLLGKLIVHAPSRNAALDRMACALDELVVQGVQTCASFLARVVREDDFRAGDLSTHYLEEHPSLRDGDSASEAEIVALAATAAHLEAEWRRSAETPRARGEATDGLSPWRTAVAPWSKRP
ncbi:MAG: acetyl-CoA carboxylase biotin carboxylase subunit [Gemmatimonadota bacterium]